MFSSETTPFSVSLIGRVWRSLACTLFGWIVMVLFLLVSYAGHASVNPRWYAAPMVFGFYSWPYIGGVWIVLVVPLFCLLPHRSRFWAWYVTPAVFALAGFLIMSALFGFDYKSPFTLRVVRLAAMVGFSTGAACVVWQRRLAFRLSAASRIP